MYAKKSIRACAHGVSFPGEDPLPFQALCCLLKLAWLISFVAVPDLRQSPCLSLWERCPGWGGEGVFTLSVSFADSSPRVGAKGRSELGRAFGHHGRPPSCGRPLASPFGRGAQCAHWAERAQKAYSLIKSYLLILAHAWSVDNIPQHSGWKGFSLRPVNLRKYCSCHFPG